MSIVQMNAATDGRRAARVASSTSVEATISLVAGRGVAGYLGDGGPATLAQLNGPTGVAVDAAGGILVVDASNRVRRIAYGTITTIAGSGVAGQVSQGVPLPEDGGPAIDAQMNDPIGIAIDHEGNILIADALYHRIRQVTADGTITTIAGNGVDSAGPGGLGPIFLPQSYSEPGTPCRGASGALPPMLRKRIAHRTVGWCFPTSPSLAPARSTRPLRRAARLRTDVDAAQLWGRARKATSTNASAPL